MMAKGTAGISKGLDEKGDAAMIVMSLKDAEAPAGGDEKDEKSDAKAAFAEVPAVVLLVPVTDYKEFLDQFHPAKAGEKVTEVEAMGKTALVASRGGYALMAAPPPQGPGDRARRPSKASTPIWPICCPGWRKTTWPAWPRRGPSNCGLPSRSSSPAR